jgi:hypothetical protein
MRRAVVACVLLVVVGLSGCAERPAGGKDVPGKGSASAGPPTPRELLRYEANAMVLQGKDGPAKLCLGGILTSLPPQCGDVPITNWDWDSVEGEERLSGSTWGDYRVEGTYDGAAFTVLEVGPRKPPSGDSFPEIEIPCPEPKGGWIGQDLSRARQSDIEAAGAFAERQPDFAGFWVKIVNPIEGIDEYQGNDIVLTFAFIGDIERHQKEMGELWGGPLCVVRHERTQAELLQIQEELSSRENEFGIQLLTSDVDVVHNVVRAEVVLADGAVRAAVERRYGKGTVQLSSALKPVP